VRVGNSATTNSEARSEADVLEEIRDERLTEVEDLANEIGVVYHELVQPRWDAEPRHFSRTLYAYVMAAFSFVDLFSTYRYTDASQTQRMRRFVSDRLGADPLAAALAIKLWRHTLMHTANPQVLVEKATGMRYRWLLHWEAELPRDQHLTLTAAAANESILNLAASYLAHDLLSAARTLFDDASASPELRQRLIAADRSIREAEL